ncbi:MAG: branched-chain amino acid ABC transporter substrate-binding protein [Gammaproteobacteria bacterium]|nr:branched-chain amino acid ABC transporter substrate-binding protein [Gammaproteobacteria bacterium]
MNLIRWIGALALVVMAGCGGEPAPASGDAVQGAALDAAGSTVEVEQRGVTDTEIVVGSYTDFSGATAIWGVGSINAARTRIDEQNTKGGVHGRQIRFVVEDTQYQVPRAIQAANKLIHRDNIFAMLLSVGTPLNNAVMPQQFEAGVPNLFPITGARSVIEPFHRFKFTQRGIYYDEVRAAVKYFIEQKGAQNVCSIYQDSDYGKEILSGTQDQLKDMGRTMAATSAHKPTETEFTAAILRLREAKCDLVLMGTVHRDTILVLEAARKMGWTGVSWVGNNAAYAQVIADHEAGEGYYAFVHMANLYADDPKSPEVQAWWDAYVERYSEDPGLAAMEGYRAADLMILAMEKAGRNLTTDALVTAIESIADYTDIFGYRIQFGPERHSGAKESVLSQVQNKRWVKLDQAITY